MSATDAKIDIKPEAAASEEAKAVEETKEETPAVAPSVCNQPPEKLQTYLSLEAFKYMNAD
jgi:hypothetical protein